MAARSPLSAFVRRAAACLVAAVVVNLVLLAVGNLAGASFLVAVAGGPQMPVGVVAVVLATAVPMLLGFAVTAIPVARRSPRAVRVLQVVGLVVAVLSLASPVLADTDLVTKVFLALMHLVVGAAWVAALAPHTQRTSRL